MTESFLIFIDVTSNGQQVELPMTLDSETVALELKCYDFAGTFINTSTNYPRYIQIKFSHPFNSMSLTNKDGYGREDCIQVPFLLNSNVFWNTPNMIWGIPIGKRKPFKRIFKVEFYDDAGVYISGLTRALLWIKATVIDKNNSTTGTTMPSL